MKKIISFGLAAALLAGCASTEGFPVLPTPMSLGLPQPDAVVVADPSMMDNTALCTYAVTIENSVAAWENYISIYLVAFGREPISLSDFVDAGDQVDALLEARNIFCVVE